MRVLFFSIATGDEAQEQAVDRTQVPKAMGVADKNACNHEFGVALDVGHTPERPGTLTARGRTEYEFNLHLAESIRSVLIQRGYKNVYVIKMIGGSETLPQRDIKANDLNANLFISLHHDSVKSSYLKTWMVDGKQQQYNDDFSGYSLFVSKKNPNWKHALTFAALLSDELLARNLHFTLHHAAQEGPELLDKDRGIYRYDDLVVLKRFNGPAVLFEAAVVVNRDEELVADTPERHKLIADAMFDAIEEFCRSQESTIIVPPT